MVGDGDTVEPLNILLELVDDAAGGGIGRIVVVARHTRQQGLGDRGVVRADLGCPGWRVVEARQDNKTIPIINKKLQNEHN